jgi:peptidoglycan hydrolase CwlO-like protein
MNCNFNSTNCDAQCKKYAMCSYLSIQKQISELQQQINFVFNAINNLIEKDNSLESNLKLYSIEMLDIINGIKKPES